VTYRLVVRRQAKLDLRRATRWYEEQRLGLGRELVAQVENVLDRITDNPPQWQVIYRDVRRAIVQKFPYGVFYRIDGSDIVVFAIVHLHRDPFSWQQRV
jgi:plasmid stabilization system protein ParE